MSKDINPWFEDVSEYARHNNDPALAEIEKIVGNRFRIPNKGKLLRVKKLIEKIQDEKIRTAILTTVNQILALGFKSEFRYHYSTVSPLKGQSSATAEFFSLLSQAITYYDYEKSERHSTSV